MRGGVIVSPSNDPEPVEGRAVISAAQALAARGTVTLSGPDNEEPARGTWNSIRRQAHWDAEGKHNV
jgi:hypothetical protein